jgi:hypothetical protein
LISNKSYFCPISMTLALDDIDENFLRGFGFLDDQKLLRLFESILRTLKMLRHPKKFFF